MDKMKQWIALTVVGVLAVMAAGWFLLVSPKRAEASDVRLEVDQAQNDVNQLRTELAMLKAQAKTLPQMQAKLAAVAAKIPDNPALPALIRALTKAADEAGVELLSLAPGAPAAVAAAAPAAQAAPTAAGASAPVTASAAGAATAGTLNAIPLSVNVVGGYFQIEQFFDRVESLTRAMKVNSFTLGGGSNPMKQTTGAGTQDDGRTLAANISANVYMALGRMVSVPPTVPAK